jgi:Mn2+/Fe2+ NRAMP family transporter
MKRALQVTLGILTAIGGFVDIGDIVANAEAGSRFGMALAWVVVVGVGGIVLFAEMAGRVATMSHRPVFDIVRERLGARIALVNLGASFFINLLTLAAEIAGIALVVQLATSVNYLLWIPLAALAVWIVIWRVKFSLMEKVFGLMGLLLLVFVVALWHFGPDWGALLHDATHPHVPFGEGRPSYVYYAIALFGAAMTPYEVFFFSSGAVEEKWGRKDLIENRTNVYVGFPLGGILSLALMALCALVLKPGGISVSTLSQAALPVVSILGKLGLVVVLIGIFAAVFGAAIETALSAGYSVSQYLGWQWGKFVAPRDAPRFHAVVIVAIALGAVIGLTTVDPIKVTEYSIVLSAAALPLTYVPILIVANDPDYMGDKVNSRLSNALASGYLVLICAVSIATVPLMILTKAGS